MGRIGFGPCTPSVLVVAADAAHKTVAQLEHERRFLEIVGIHNNFDRITSISFGVHAGVDPVSSDTLDFIFVELVTGAKGRPADSCLVAVGH